MEKALSKGLVRRLLQRELSNLGKGSLPKVKTRTAKTCENGAEALRKELCFLPVLFVASPLVSFCGSTAQTLLSREHAMSLATQAIAKALNVAAIF